MPVEYVEEEVRNALKRDEKSSSSKVELNKESGIAKLALCDENALENENSRR